jgi:hypothetical protein
LLENNISKSTIFFNMSIPFIGMTLDPILAILPEVASPETSGAGHAIGPCRSSTQIPLNWAKTIKV